MSAKTKGYDIEQVVDVIEMLADSNGFYGQLLEKILYVEENQPRKYEAFKRVIEDRGFEDPEDVVNYFKH